MTTQTVPRRRRHAGERIGAPRPAVPGALVLSIGIAATGLFTFTYLAVGSHVLGKTAYSRVALCWSIMFVIVSVIYRPIEQLLSRTIADRHARGSRGSARGTLRTPALIQLAFALVFLAAALALHQPLEHDVFDGSGGLYAILLIGVTAYAASYFARGWLAGHRQFALYGGLVFLESTSRFLFALAAAIGISSGQVAVAAGMAAAPFVSLCVLPFAFSRMRAHLQDHHPVAEAGPPTDVSLRQGGHFAASVVAIMLSEQALMNAGVIVVAARSGFNLTSGLTGFVFNVLLIVRAPLQLFQAVQTSILPHLTGLNATSSDQEFRRSVRLTTTVTLGTGVVVALGLLAIGPAVMRVAVGGHGFTYGRLGLAAMGIGMGLHLTAGTLNQALLARGRAALSALAWLTAATAFVLFVALPTIPNAITRTEVGYCGATALLVLLLWSLQHDVSIPSNSGSLHPL